jgi:hypothetical protein
MIWLTAITLVSFALGAGLGAIVNDRIWQRRHRERVAVLRRCYQQPTYRIPVKNRLDAMSRRDDGFVKPHTN